MNADGQVAEVLQSLHQSLRLSHDACRNGQGFGNRHFTYQAARCAVPLNDVRAVQAVLNELLPQHGATQDRL